ncbi:hypothetical protein [Streptomyces sp. 2A115]|uniref:hypothetical protein n=1 Tax=Streptomyces sp. 2A115 TaxID=3457439 RepID=UPI003FD5E3ED
MRQPVTDTPYEKAFLVGSQVMELYFGLLCHELGRARHEIRTDDVADALRALSRSAVRRSRPTTPEEHDGVARAVRQACLSEDAELLASLLCPDATAFFDGGGTVRALIRPVHGGRQVAQSLLTLMARHPRTTLTAQSVNGRTGLVVRYGRQVAAVISLDIADHQGTDIADHQVTQVWVILNPDTLRSWNPLAPHT